ncbi:MAG TPA: glycosyltransferase family 87 protein [Steroidobacter sp.]|uniref:glycosyltransferase family 87 protein n=1 Tax=Steroidobacter sp. TaxID=1978227 RepID=UPI002ED9F0B1
MDAVENAVSVRTRLAGNPALLCIGVLTLLALVTHAPLLIDFTAGMLGEGYPLNVIDVDFVNYWMAGVMTTAGMQQDLFSFPVYYGHLEATFGANYPIHNWGYPPHFLLLLWPLGLLSYKAAMVAFLTATFALFVMATLVFRRAYAPNSSVPLLALAVFGYSLLMIYTTQNGFLTGALLLFGLAWMKSRPVAAGLAFALLTIKPQLGVLIPVLLVLDRNWRTIGWSALFTVALVALSAAWYGTQSWASYLTETLDYQRSVMTDWSGLFLRMMPTVFASMRTLDYTPDTAYMVQWPFSIAGAAVVLWAWRWQTDPLQRIFTLACGTFVISPYAFNYDMGALGVIAALLVGSQSLSRFALIMVSIIAALSPCVTNLGRSNLPISPVLLLMGLAALALHAQQMRREPLNTSFKP